MKKKILIVVSILIGIVLANLIYNSLYKERFVKDNPNLYNQALEYLKSHNNDKYQNKNDYQLFITADNLAITKDRKYKFVYMWIMMQSCYVKDNELIKASSSSMIYKFTFQDGKIIKYTLPKDGIYYEKSIKKMIPRSLQKKVLNYDNHKLEEKIDKDIKQHYRYLEET